ncbi:two-component sensor histidine kinase [Streptomyces spiroverticillatus]|uniref:histidine kinase n=1 Tax=Streptomyces finlayi TaxID=67296 RepID=A0A918X612_9ACTN|nr:two-component sensor histidine kinase [Streptomyces spiroverticillatus]GHD13672.1 two-component sensor histidine kinase [Streptomyces finlayi]
MGALLVALIVAEGVDAGYLPVGVAIVLCGTAGVAALIVPAHRLWPVGILTVVASCVFSSVSTQLSHRPPHTPGTVETGVMMLLVVRAVRFLPPRTMVPLAVGAWAAALLVNLRMPEYEWPKFTKFVGPGLVLCGVLMLILGMYLRLLDTSRLREQQHHLQTQRLEHARDLHDFVGHHVSAIVAQAKAARFITSSGRPLPTDELDRMLAAMEEAGSQAMESMRTMVGVLRDPADVQAGGSGGDLTELRVLADALARGGPEVELSVAPDLVAHGLPPHLAKAIRHVVQESLTNVRKHAENVQRVRIQVRRLPRNPARLSVTVTDDGRGHRIDRTGSSGPVGGFGILGLTERVEALGGTLSADGGSGTGWTLHAELPLAEGPSSRARAAVPARRFVTAAGNRTP